MSLITEFHGWMTIRYTYENSDSALLLEEQCLPSVIRQLEEKIEREGLLEEFSLFTGKVELNSFYGEYFLTATGFSWHYDMCSKIISLFETAAKLAVGSYGLLYVKTEENEGFQVYKICRGTVIIQEDPFLSPCIPIIEDEPAD